MSPSFEAFAAEQRAIGCDEVLERVWKPEIVVGTHTHPFSVRALVAQGDMWLTIGERVQHLVAGERFELDHGVPHAERYGSRGAIVWVARTGRAK